ncbi:uncharacterized protein YkwD [Hydrogenoanaerobacterium saccharovorans]|uniref:Uncharacterized conserved protein YkwD, contains CAP (CSP/antigen 5/PR1) domain n=1 Tax=Hydrogenoanaerobacterium saccharovorans TaxID=474960 RepID=A0A1H8BEW2_9FIRM|nr:CAP domain-containing protein [Hydrogenoanaerobacterium saccharovorans]RPF47474.1 uncharacterized protein YkwD [Hydrogenoanaerobacterium saccharovorans]SEM80674.1 Uncharacterized conserved protein YkwD, contains CAP (CSP/antigen 5/PR1) domain [Hydrogenoanaerobacterium saccharovorans]
MKPFKKTAVTLSCAIIAISSMSVSASAKAPCDTNKKVGNFFTCSNVLSQTTQDKNCDWNVIFKQLTKGFCINIPNFNKQNAADAAKNCVLQSNGNTGTVKPDCSKTDCSKTDCSKTDCSKTDCSKTDCSKTDCSKTDCSKPETSKPETSKPETSKPETSKPETSKPETSKPETSKPETSKPDDNQVAMSEYAQEVVRLVNEERAAAGLSALKVDVKVLEAAQVRAEEQPILFSHTRPNGTSCFTALDEAGATYRGAGENIAYGQRSPEQVMDGWMNSSGHRANILNPNYKYIGVGFYKGSNGTLYWSQMFTY